jgi:hypothetical protein
MELSILPECYVDTNLIESLVPPVKGYNHQKGCGTVTKRMQEKLHDRFAVGILDKDKKELKYVQEFDLKIDIGDLQLLRHKNPDKQHYLIFIYPAIEKWIMKNIELAGISLEYYGLPNDLFELTKITKRVTSKKDKTFKLLFEELKKHKVPNVEILSLWIKYLREKNYNADLEELVQLTNNRITI